MGKVKVENGEKNFRAILPGGELGLYPIGSFVRKSGGEVEWILLKKYLKSNFSQFDIFFKKILKE